MRDIATTYSKKMLKICYFNSHSSLVRQVISDRQYSHMVWHNVLYLPTHTLANRQTSHQHTLHSVCLSVGGGVTSSTNKSVPKIIINYTIDLLFF